MPTTTSNKRSPRLPREQRRELLLDAVLGLVAEHGFAGVSMEAVARRAKIAKTVVYDAFGDQQQMLRALLEREQERVLETIAAAMPAQPLEGEPAEILEAAITTALYKVREHPDTWRFILLPADGTPPFIRDEVNRHRERLVKQIEPMAKWGLQQLGLDELDAELAAYAILSAAEDSARLTVTYPRRFSPERLAGFTAGVVRAIAGASGGPARR